MRLAVTVDGWIDVELRPHNFPTAGGVKRLEGTETTNRLKPPHVLVKSSLMITDETG